MEEAKRKVPFNSPTQVDGTLNFESKAARCIAATAERVGAPSSVVPKEVQRVLDATWPREVLDNLEAQGLSLQDALIVDLGAGLGACSREAALRGANPIGVEPGSGWRELASERVRETGRGLVVAAIGEELPFRDNSIDAVVSLMVLEHVSDPSAVLKEVFRILKPGGLFFLACENYFRFVEPHYGVAWFPLLPKPIGALYLRLRGRPTEFLYDSITYTTRYGVVSSLTKIGFEFLSHEDLAKIVATPEIIRSRKRRMLMSLSKRFFSDKGLLELLVLAGEVRQTFHVISEMLRKPRSAS